MASFSVQQRSADRPPAAERDFETELACRRRAARLLAVGLNLIIAGLVVIFFFPRGHGGLREDIWLYRDYGQSGLVWGARGAGILMMLIGTLLLYIASRRLTAGVRTRGAGSR